MLARLGQVLIVSALVCSPAHAAASDSIAIETLMLQLRTIESELHLMSDKLEDMAKDIGEMKECNALARLAPKSLDEMRKLIKPANKEDDSTVVDLYKKDALARIKCGLLPK